MQFSTELRNARANAIETIAGASPILKIRTGAAPANCAAADSGTVLSTHNLPADAWSDASNGVKSLQGSWNDSAADASGTAGHYRLYKADGTTCVAQGPAGVGAELNLLSAALVAGQPVNILSWATTEGNA